MLKWKQLRLSSTRILPLLASSCECERRLGGRGSSHKSFMTIYVNIRLRDYMFESLYFD